MGKWARRWFGRNGCEAIWPLNPVLKRPGSVVPQLGHRAVTEPAAAHAHASTKAQPAKPAQSKSATHAQAPAQPQATTHKKTPAAPTDTTTAQTTSADTTPTQTTESRGKSSSPAPDAPSSAPRSKP